VCRDDGRLWPSWPGSGATPAEPAGFHHLIVVHRWGWQLILNPDGTRTAISPDGQRVLHSHSPPARAA
jgi:hypothetical protein